MAWIWETEKCEGQYGGCVRHICFFVVSVLVAALSIYSVIAIYRRLEKYKFEMIPLIINCLAAIGMLAIFSQIEVFNTHLLMMVIEIYSYSLISYSYIGLYLRSESTVSVNTIKRLKYGFIVWSAVIVVAIGIIIYLTAANQISCTDDHGLGSLILYITEIPLYVATILFIVKTKRKIDHLEKRKPKSQLEHFLRDDQDLFIKIRHRQANFTMVAFTISLILHICTLALFITIELDCDEQGFYKVVSVEELTILVMEDISEIIPHIVLPLIFYFIPEKFQLKNPPVEIVPNKPENTMNSGLISNYENQVAMRHKYQQIK